MSKVKEPTTAYYQVPSRNPLYLPQVQKEERRIYTYDDFLTFPSPSEGIRYEIINGEVFMSAAPYTIHQRTLGELYSIIRTHVRKHKLGEVYFAPIDIVLSFTNIVEPDLIFISEERKDTVAKKNIIEPPDFVVEVLSEWNKTYDEIKKKNLYEQFGVKEYWIVDPEKQTVRQFILEKGKYTTEKIFSSKEKITSVVIKGLKLNVKKIFET
jgi:Uma2 family endonuclease